MPLFLHSWQNVSCFKLSYWMRTAGPDTAADGRIGAMQDVYSPAIQQARRGPQGRGALAATGHSLRCIRTCPHLLLHAEPARRLHDAWGS